MAEDYTVSVNVGPKKKEVKINFEGKEFVFKIDKETGNETIGPGAGTAPLGDLELKKGQAGGKISGIVFPSPNEVVIFTNSPGCAWYWNGRYWIWMCT